MKKLLAVLLTLALLAGLSACGKNKTESESSSESSTVVTPSQSEANEEIVSSIMSAVNEEEAVITERIAVGFSDSETFIYSGRSILLGKTYDFSRDCDGNGQEEYFKVELNTPSGLKALAAVEGFGYNLANAFTLEAGFDEVGDIREDYYLQFSFHDLDGDGDEELLLSLGNLLDLSETLVYTMRNSSFEFCGLIRSGARLRYDGENLNTTDELVYFFTDGTLCQQGEDGEAEEVPAEISDEALEKDLTQLIQPLIITYPESFSKPSALSDDTLLYCGLFGYLLNTNPEVRTYTDTEVLMPAADVDIQLSLLFGDSVSLNPDNYPAGEGVYVYYSAEDDCYHMPLTGYTCDQVRVDSLSQSGDSVVMTVSQIYVEPGESVDSLEGMDAARVIEVTFTEYEGRWVVSALKVVE